MNPVELTVYPSTFMTVCGGRIRCVRCNAKSKRTGEQCRAAAVKGGAKCKWHGGRRTSPRTAEGRKRIAQANTVHGLETRAARSNRSIDLARLAELEALGYAIGLLSGPRTRGPEPKGA
jgi:hypothetical protein